MAKPNRIWDMVQQAKIERFQILVLLFVASNYKLEHVCGTDFIAKDAGIDIKSAHRQAQYLAQKGLIRDRERNRGEKISITVTGIDYVERLVERMNAEKTMMEKLKTSGLEILKDTAKQATSAIAIRCFECLMEAMI